jgi:succinate dehydrogenase / fumarate reductase membrane anchor subunit
MNIKFVTGDSGTKRWFYQRITGIFLVVLLLVHFTIMHFIGTGETDYQTVAPRLASPYWKTFDLAFLIFALYHGLAGLWVVVDDYVHKDGWRIFIYSLIVLGGALLLVLGALTIITFSPQMLTVKM